MRSPRMTSPCVWRQRVSWFMFTSHQFFRSQVRRYCGRIQTYDTRVNVIDGHCWFARDNRWGPGSHGKMQMTEWPETLLFMSVFARSSSSCADRLQLTGVKHTIQTWPTSVFIADWCTRVIFQRRFESDARFRVSHAARLFVINSCLVPSRPQQLVC